MVQETWTVRSLIRATQRVSGQRHFDAWWGTFEEAWIAHFTLDCCPSADFTTGPAQLFLSCGQHSFHFATHVAAILSFTGSANGRNRRSCILAAAVYHSSVYCTASAYCSPPAHLYIMVQTCNHWTKNYDANILETYRTCILWSNILETCILWWISWCVKGKDHNH